MPEVCIEFTFDELGVLCAALKCPLPVGVAGDDFELPDSLAARFRDRAASTLHSRRVIEGGEVNDAVASVLRLGAEPMLIVTVELEEGPVLDTIFLACDSDLAVEIREFAPQVFRLTPFVTRDVVGRIGRLSDLRPASVANVGSISIDAAALARAAEAAVSNPFAAQDVLTAEGVESIASEILAAALAERRRTVAVTAIHRPDDDLVEGGTLSWIDCGLLGNWIAEGDEDITEMESGGPTGLLTLRSVEASEIQETLLSYLPLAFTSDEGDPTAEEGQNALPA